MNKDAIKNSDTRESRREFLRTWARRLAVGILAGGGVALASRKPNDAAVDHTCINQGICPGCPSFKECELPQAASAKQAQKQ